MNSIITLFLYLLLASSGLWAIQTKIKQLLPAEKQAVRFEAWACRITMLIPILNLFVWLWVVTEGLETHCPQAGKSWTGGG